MTTKNSPPAKLKAQADKIAKFMKGTTPIPGKLTLKAVIVMDDKTMTVEMTWAAIAETSEPALAAYILAHMQERQTDS